jgi:hypothetical protein
MTHFPPSPSILSSVLLTRAAYAQLQGQVFHPPRVFGPEWHIREGAEMDNERKWRDLGVKIATGFEIMYKEGGKKGRSGEVSGAFLLLIRLLLTLPLLSKRETKWASS